MIIESRKITVIRINKPIEKDINKELQWLGNSLGLFSIRDRDKSCYRIFLELLKSARVGRTMSSDEIAEKLNLTRGTVVHHINKLMEAGIVVHQKQGYMLRVDNLARLIEELQRDLHGMCKSLREVAVEIDSMLG